MLRVASNGPKLENWALSSESDGRVHDKHSDDEDDWTSAGRLGGRLCARRDVKQEGEEEEEVEEE